MERILDKLSKAVSISLVSVASIVLVSWVFIMVIFVTARSLFNVNWMFIEEYSGYSMVLLTSFSFAHALRGGAHIRVTAISEIFPLRTQKVLKVFADLFGLAVTGYLTWHGIKWFLNGLEGGTLSWFPSRTILWPVYVLIPIGLAALTLEFLHQFISGLSMLGKGRAEKS